MTTEGPIRMLVCDFDGTLVPLAAGVATAGEVLGRVWKQLREPPLFVINSGRRLDDLQRALAGLDLPRPDYLIGGVGTQNLALATGRAVAGWEEYLGQAFDRQRVEAIVAARPGILRQPDRYQGDFKSSWYWQRQDPAAIADLEGELLAAGLQVRLVYSSDRDLDVLPRSTDKGLAVSWLCQQLQIPLSTVLVAGDTGNDSALFRLPGARGILVGNAKKELRMAVAEAGAAVYVASGEHVFGVVEGLQFYGLGEGQ